MINTQQQQQQQQQPLIPNFWGQRWILNKLIRVNRTVKKIEKKIYEVAQSDLNAQLISTFLEFVRQNSHLS